MGQKFIRQAIELARANVQRDGGPFAALVVKDGIVIATGAQSLMLGLPNEERLGHFQLTGCDLYASCEPCPMCLGAIFWARPARVFFAATHEDAAAAGFDDSFIYRQIEVPHAQRSIPMIRVVDELSTRPFEEWVSRAGKTEY